MSRNIGYRIPHNNASLTNTCQTRGRGVCSGAFAARYGASAAPTHTGTLTALARFGGSLEASQDAFSPMRATAADRDKMDR